MKQNNKKDVLLVIETVLLFGLIFFLIMSIFYNEFYLAVEILSSLLLFTFGVNNLSVKHQKKEGIIYIICGIIILVITII